MIVLALSSFCSALSNPPYPISQGACQANLNGFFYNLTSLVARDPDIYNDTLNGFDYIVRFCSELSKSDIGGQSDLDLLEVYAVRCRRADYSQCIQLATALTFDFRFIDSADPSRGVIYRAEGEPFYDQFEVFAETFDIELLAYCDPNGRFDAPATAYFDWRSTSITLRFNVSFAGGCPSPVPIPTPTATPWVPKCLFVRRDPVRGDVGIDVDFAEFNSGPFGARTPIWIDGTERLLYLQACERSYCPTGHNCQDDTLSSAWLCDHRADTKTCASLGVIDGTPRVELLNHTDIGAGVQLQIGTLKANITCWPFDPLGHLFFDPTAVVIGSDITLKATSANLCSQYIPPPSPGGGNCSYFDTTSAHESLSLNLTQYNRNSTGWNAPVRVTGAKEEQGALIYQPCGGVACPVGAFCEGDEDATVWLCGPSGCFGYGLFQYAVEIAFNNPAHAVDGVGVHYEGNVHRYAKVDWLCDASLAPGVLRIADTVKLDGDLLSFQVWAADSCATAPSPTPTVEVPNVSVGAVIMVVVLSGMVAYLSGGVLFRLVRTGKVAFPNQEFWGGVSESIAAPFRRRSDAEYEAINTNAE
jgi:hypothetical protein